MARAEGDVGQLPIFMICHRAAPVIVELANMPQHGKSVTPGAKGLVDMR